MAQCFHWISLPILAELTGKSENKLRKLYRTILENECVPLSDIPKEIQDKYLSEYLLRDKLIDFSFLSAIKYYPIRKPINSPEVRELISEMLMLREARWISAAFSAAGTTTIRLRELAANHGISYSTFARRRKAYMNNTSLSRALMHESTTEDTVDRYRKCCFYCRDLIIFQHELPGKISGAKIYRDITNSKPFPCMECPYHPDVKNGPHKKGDCIPVATCARNSEYMIRPGCEDTVCTIINRIPEQQDVLAWEGVRSWANKFHYTPAREKPSIVNQVWFSDHKKLDLMVRTRQLPDGTWEHRRPWITAILDAASDVMVSYVLSLNPNSDCIAECFARGCAFTVDTPYCGIPDYLYIDNGKDYRSKKLNGLPNTEDGDSPLFLNKEFGESGILEWFGIKTIHALPYRGCSKTIERFWKTIDDEWIRGIPGYCGSKPEERPFILDDQMRNNETYTFEQFADYFAETIYPAYNDFSVTKEAPNVLYARLPKASSFVPTWRTLAVLKSVSGERVIRPKGIQYGNNKYYWCSELGPLIEKEETTKYRVFAFDTPFNRNISVVRDHQYIGEAHLIEKLNVVEKKRYKVIQHVAEQARQHKYYSTRIKQIHAIIMQTDILNYIPSAPPADHIRYGQAIDEDRDKKEAIDDTSIPEELKEQAEKYAASYLNPEPEKSEPGRLTLMFREIGKQARNNI